MKCIKKTPMVMIVIGVIGISFSSIFVRLSGAPSAVTAALRMLWTVLLMSPVSLGKREMRIQFRSMGRRSFLLSILSGIFLALHFWLWFESLAHTSVASSTTIVCTEVIWVSLGYCLFMKGRISMKATFAIAAALAGSAMVAYADSASGTSQLYGDILSLLAAIAVAVYTLIGRTVRKSISTVIYTYVVYAACAICLILTVLIQGHQLFAYGPGAIIVGLLLALFSTILGHSIFSWCLKFFSPSFVSASKLCEPAAAAVMAALIFGEFPSPLQLLGGAIILGAVFFYSRIEKSQE